MTRGFQSFLHEPGPGYHVVVNSPAELSQRGPGRRAGVAKPKGNRNAPRTFKTAMQWLEHHYKEDFFLYIDTWDPHEPWDAPSYYTEPYWPGYDGEVVLPVYGNWHDVPGYTRREPPEGPRHLLRRDHHGRHLAGFSDEVPFRGTWA